MAMPERFSADALRQFASTLLQRAGLEADKADSVAATLVDGDLIFSVSTGERPLNDPIFDAIALGHAAAVCLARAIARAVYHATPVADDVFPTWQQKWGRRS